MSTKATGVLAFLALSFGLAWAGMYGSWFLGLSLVNPLVQLPWAFTPAIAAVIVRRWVTKEGFGDAGMRLRLKSAWPHYVAAWLGPLALAAASVAVAAALGVWRPDLTPLDNLVPGLPGWAFLLLLMLVVPLLAPIYWGEEFGWTSYLRLRIFTDRPVLSVTVTGLIWAIWHYPLAFLGYIEFDNVLLGLAVWTVSFQLQEIILAWLRSASGSIWTTSIAHAGNNMVLSLLTGILLQEKGKLDVVAVMLITMVPMIAVSAWIVLSGQLRDRPGSPAGTRRTRPGSGRSSAPPPGPADAPVPGSRRW